MNNNDLRKIYHRKKKNIRKRTQAISMRPLLNNSHSDLSLFKGSSAIISNNQTISNKKESDYVKPSISVVRTDNNNFAKEIVVIHPKKRKSINVLTPRVEPIFQLKDKNTEALTLNSDFLNENSISREINFRDTSQTSIDQSQNVTVHKLSNNQNKNQETMNSRTSNDSDDNNYPRHKQVIINNQKHNIMRTGRNINRTHRGNDLSIAFNYFENVPNIYKKNKFTIKKIPGFHRPLNFGNMNLRMVKNAKRLMPYDKLAYSKFDNPDYKMDYFFWIPEIQLEPLVAKYIYQVEQKSFWDEYPYLKKEIENTNWGLYEKHYI